MSVETLDFMNCYSSQNGGNAKARLGKMPTVVQQTIYEWLRRHRSRRALANLDARMLEDIGLNKSQVEAEVIKPFWVR